MISRTMVAGLCAVLLVLTGCSRQQSGLAEDPGNEHGRRLRAILEEVSSGEFTAQAEARVKELYEERELQKARDADTPEAYQAFLKQYPERQMDGGSAHSRREISRWPRRRARPLRRAALRAQAPARGGRRGKSHLTRPGEGDACAGRTGGRNAAPKIGRGDYGVQLGAFKSGPEAAHKRWVRLQKEYPALLGGLSSKVLISKTSAGQLYRLQTTGSDRKARPADLRLIEGGVPGLRRGSTAARLIGPQSGVWASRERRASLR